MDGHRLYLVADNSHALHTESLTILDTIEKEQLGKALGRLASGVFVVTANSGARAEGMLATFINQAAFDPPSIVVAMNNERPFFQSLTPGSTFTVNVLSSKNMNIFKAFAKPASGAEDDRFAGLNARQNGGAGVIFEEAVSYLTCKCKAFLEAGDHTIVLAEVTGGELLNGSEQPMVHLRNNGFQY